MPDPVPLSPRLERLFANTKLVCFGRYALEVPAEAMLAWGTAAIPSDIETLAGGVEARKQRVAKDIAKLKWENSDAEVFYDGPGPTESSWQLRYYSSESAKEFDDYMFRTYVSIGEVTFLLGDAPRDGETLETVVSRQARKAKILRLRAPDDVPVEPGYCLKEGFLPDDLYKDQEMVSIGMHFPSLPDVTFSVSSNKNAYSDYSPAEFERRWRRELSLLDRIKQAQESQGTSYPSRHVLREGQRIVQHWHGEESLFRRNDGVHDFEWAFVGTPKDVANPSEYSAHMYTKVAYDTVGAAKAASLTDAEAVALWDRLLSGLKFRVKVPGAPEGSYYFPPAENKPGAKL